MRQRVAGQRRHDQAAPARRIGPADGRTPLYPYAAIPEPAGTLVERAAIAALSDCRTIHNVTAMLLRMSTVTRGVGDHSTANDAHELADELGAVGQRLNAYADALVAHAQRGE